jgi:hypothetical protein
MRGDGWGKSPHCLSQEPLCPVASHGGAGRPPSRNSDSQVALRVLVDNQNDKRVGIGPAGTPHPLEIFRPGQTKLSLHPQPQRAICRLPADFFHMVVGGLRQLRATTQAAALEHRAPICRSHALAKAVHAHAAADLRLIRTFGHSSFLVSKIMAAAFQSGTTLYRRASDSVNLDSPDNLYRGFSRKIKTLM